MVTVLRYSQITLAHLKVEGLWSEVCACDCYWRMSLFRLVEWHTPLTPTVVILKGRNRE